MNEPPNPILAEIEIALLMAEHDQATIEARMEPLKQLRFTDHVARSEYESLQSKLIVILYTIIHLLHARNIQLR